MYSESVQTSSPNNKVHVYTPDQQIGWGINIWREMFKEISGSRELIWRLFLRDLSARYRQSILGLLWALILPVISVGTFVFLNSSGLLNVGDIGIPYPVYALLGLTVWQMFSSGLTVCSGAIIAGGSMVVKINFPKETLVLSAMGQVFIELLVRLILLAVLMVIFQVTPKWTLIFFPLTLIPIIFITLGLGLLLSLLSALMRDIISLVTVVTTFLMFLTPVVYPNPGTGTMALVMSINPLSGPITAARDMVINGYLTDPNSLAWSSVISILIFFVSWRLFHMVEPRMAERV